MAKLGKFELLFGAADPVVVKMADLGFDHVWPLGESAVADPAADFGSVGGAPGTYTSTVTLGTASITPASSATCATFAGSGSPTPMVTDCGDTTTLNAVLLDWVFTLSFVYKPTTALQGETIFATMTGVNQKGVRIEGLSTGSTMRLGLKNGSASENHASPVGLRELNVAHLVTITSDGTTIKYYKDGAILAGNDTITIATTTGNTQSPPTIGADPAPAIPMRGVLQYMGVALKELSAAEVLDLAQTMGFA